MVGPLTNQTKLGRDTHASLMPTISDLVYYPYVADNDCFFARFCILFPFVLFVEYLSRFQVLGPCLFLIYFACIAIGKLIKSDVCMVLFLAY